MIRCREEVTESRMEKKGTEHAADPRRPLVRLGFDALLARDTLRMHTLRTPEDLRRLGDEVRVTVKPDEFGRFVAWVEARYGNAFARQGGLPVGPPRLYLAS